MIFLFFKLDQGQKDSETRLLRIHIGMQGVHISASTGRSEKKGNKSSQKVDEPSRKQYRSRSQFTKKHV